MPLLTVVVVGTIIFSSCLAWPTSSTFTVVKHLPGFDGAPLPFYLETWYVEVDEVKDAHIFYYFVKSERNPEEDPIVVWLTGGPGCSGVSGLLFEIGPLKIDVPGYTEGLPSLFYSPYTWTKWYIIHREFLSNPLYIGGDSYSGIVVPLVAQEVANGNQAALKVSFNLKGYLVGNPVTDGQFDNGAFVPYAHGMGPISDELYKSAEKSCGGEYASPMNAKCADSLLSINECLEGLNYAHILEPSCFYVSPKPPKVVTDRRRALEELFGKLPLSKANLPLECRGTKQDWKRCNYDLPSTSDIPSSVNFHQNLTNRGYRALIYSGDHDMFVPHVGTQAWIRSLNSSIVDDWRSWSVNGQVAGFTRTYSNNLTFATVKGGGHTAPEYKPKECQAMFHRWISQIGAVLGLRGSSHLSQVYDHRST